MLRICKVCLDNDSVTYLISVGNMFVVFSTVVQLDQILLPPVLDGLPVRFELNIVNHIVLKH